MAFAKIIAHFILGTVIEYSTINDAIVHNTNWTKYFVLFDDVQHFIEWITLNKTIKAVIKFTMKARLVTNQLFSFSILFKMR